MTVSRLHILALVGVLAVLAASLRVARRRRFTDAAALVSLVAMLVAGGVVAASQLVSPTPPYLLEWMKVVGAFVWFAVGWTCWCVVEARVVGAPARGRHLAAAAAGIAVLGGIAWSWGDASRNAPPHDERPGLVAEIRAALQSELDDDLTYRVAVVGDPTGHHQGIFYWLIRDGHDVVTSDGSAGLKWGRRHVWERGDHVDSHITIAVHYGNSLSPAFDECSRDSDQDLLFFQSDLGQDDLTWIEDVNLRRLEESDTISPAEEARWDELTDRDFRVAVFEGDQNCGRDDAGWDDAEQDDDADGS